MMCQKWSNVEDDANGGACGQIKAASEVGELGDLMLDGSDAKYTTRNTAGDKVLYYALVASWLEPV